MHDRRCSSSDRIVTSTSFSLSGAHTRAKYAAGSMGRTTTAPCRHTRKVSSMCKAWYAPNDRLGAYLVCSFPCGITAATARFVSTSGEGGQIKFAGKAYSFAEGWMFRASSFYVVCSDECAVEKRYVPVRDKRSECVTAGTLLN